MKPGLLVLVVNHGTKRTLGSVLERIPYSLFDEHDVELLFVDDASEDGTVEAVERYRALYPERSTTMVRNELAQGHGGKQKIGYAFAIERGFDHVVLLDGSGRHPPEELPGLVKPLREGNADAVLGSRMTSILTALRGGVPLRQFATERLLAGVQNALLGTHFTELHFAHRAYSVHALSKLPFLLDSNDARFDTEILVQLLQAKARIVELPVAVHGGAVVGSRARVSSKALGVAARGALHRVGLLYQRRFDAEPEDNTIYELKLGYPSSHTMVLERIPVGSNVLDVGAGPGALAREIVKRGSRVTTVDKHPPGVDSPDVEAVQQDLDEPIRFVVEGHSHILMLDIIEHLKSPERFLDELRTQFAQETKTLLVTSPNVAFVVQRLMLALGQFNYGKRGILDRTHTRLFTFRSLERLLRDAGFRIKAVVGIPAPFPKVLGNGVLGRVAIAVNLALISVSKTLFSYQILVEAETSPGVAFILGEHFGKRTAPPASRHFGRSQSDSVRSNFR